MRPEILGKLIKVNYLIESLSRDLTACSIVSQTLRYRMSPSAVNTQMNFHVLLQTTNTVGN
jgi:hypothetical protein